MFAALMGSALMRGRAGAPCACFGARSTVSGLSVLRNLALAAGFAVAPSLSSGDASADGWLALGLGLAVFTSEGCHLRQTLAPAIDDIANDPRVALRISATRVRRARHIGWARDLRC